MIACNCWGLVRLIYENKLGLKLGDIKDQRMLIADGTWTQVDLEDARQFDILLFKGCEMERHVGMVISRTAMIHATEGFTSGIDRFGGILWKNKLRSVYRHHLL